MTTTSRPSPLFARLGKILFSVGAAARSVSAREQGHALSEQEAILEDTACASEAVILERLSALTEEPVDEVSDALLTRILEVVPTEKLQSILSENAKHGFLSNATVERILERLPLERLSELSELCSEESCEKIFGRRSVLGRVRGAVVAVASREEKAIGGLPSPKLLRLAFPSCKTPEGKKLLLALFVRLLGTGERERLLFVLEAARPLEDFVLALERPHLLALAGVDAGRWAEASKRSPELPRVLSRQLVVLLAQSFRPGAADGEDGPLYALLLQLFEALDPREVWTLICLHSQGCSERHRAEALAFFLGKLDEGRAASMIAGLFGDTEIKIYWPLFPEGLRRALRRSGRGPLFAGSASRASTASSETRAGREAPRGTNPRQAHGHVGGPARGAREHRERAEALRVMVGTFGFRAEMTYREAQKEYWRLACQYHPDRAGDDPLRIQRIKELNWAWSLTKGSFTVEAPSSPARSGGACAQSF